MVKISTTIDLSDVHTRTNHHIILEVSYIKVKINITTFAAESMNRSCN